MIVVYTVRIHNTYNLWTEKETTLSSHTLAERTACTVQSLDKFVFHFGYILSSFVPYSAVIHTRMYDALWVVRCFNLNLLFTVQQQPHGKAFNIVRLVVRYGHSMFCSLCLCFVARLSDSSIASIDVNEKLCV